MANENVNDGRILDEDDEAPRINQRLLIGIVLSVVVAISLAISMPSSWEIGEPSIPSDDPIVSPEFIPTFMKNETLNKTKSVKLQEETLETKILREIAIHKSIHMFENDDDEIDYNENLEEGEERSVLTKEEAEKRKIDQIVLAFMASQDFETFIEEIELDDAIKQLDKESGYERPKNHLNDDLYERYEAEILGKDKEEARLIKKVGDEMYRKAREEIEERKRKRKEAYYNEDDLEENIDVNEKYYETKPKSIGDKLKRRGKSQSQKKSALSL